MGEVAGVECPVSDRCAPRGGPIPLESERAKTLPAGMLEYPTRFSGSASLPDRPMAPPIGHRALPISRRTNPFRLPTVPTPFGHFIAQD
jgi:hypothetical protein